MGAASFTNAYDGIISQSESMNVVQKERVPAAYLNGIPSSWRDDLYTARTKERTFRFIGLSETDAFSTNPQTIGGVTIPMQSSFTDGSSGTAVFQKETVRVTRERMSPSLWTVTVTQTGSELYLNGTLLIAGPTWM